MVSIYFWCTLIVFCQKNCFFNWNPKYKNKSKDLKDSEESFSNSGSLEKLYITQKHTIYKIVNYLMKNLIIKGWGTKNHELSNQKKIDQKSKN